MHDHDQRNQTKQTSVVASHEEKLQELQKAWKCEDIDLDLGCLCRDVDIERNCNLLQSLFDLEFTPHFDSA